MSSAELLLILLLKSYLTKDTKLITRICGLQVCFSTQCCMDLFPSKQVQWRISIYSSQREYLSSQKELFCHKKLNHCFQGFYRWTLQRDWHVLKFWITPGFEKARKAMSQTKKKTENKKITLEAISILSMSTTCFTRETIRANSAIQITAQSLRTTQLIILMKKL